MIKRSSVTEMIHQSRAVLSRPGVATFERYESRGTLQNALVYVALAAALTGLFGLSEGLGGFVRNILITLIGFFVFTYFVYRLGKRRGGSGTLDEVAYTFALFWAPLSVLFAVVTLLLVVTLIGVVFLPFVGLAALAANVYFAYLAVQSSMNLKGDTTTWTVLGLAALGAFVVNLVVGALV